MKLVAMTDAEFASYLEDAWARYAVDIDRATEWTADEAVAKARAQLDALLPAGLQTPGHGFLRVLGDEGERVGAIWIAAMRTEVPPRLFLYDIHLDAAVRGRGLGTRVMTWLEDEARVQHLGAVGLSVFRHNTGAARLYERLGYTVESSDSAGLRMFKRLPEPA